MRNYKPVWQQQSLANPHAHTNTNTHADTFTLTHTPHATQSPTWIVGIRSTGKDVERGEFAGKVSQQRVELLPGPNARKQGAWLSVQAQNK